MEYLIDMTQYKGDDQELVIAGHQIIAGLGDSRAVNHIMKAATYVSLGYSDGPLLNYLTAWDLLGGPYLNRQQAVPVLAYLKVYDRIRQVKERLTRQYSVGIDYAATS
jgi:hypothetical protein